MGDGFLSIPGHLTSDESSTQRLLKAGHYHKNSQAVQIITSKVLMSTHFFLQETSHEQRVALINVLDQVITNTLKSGRPVLMEGFGVIIMKQAECARAYNMGKLSALRTEQVRSYEFEKCEHFECDYNNRYKKIVKTSDLARLCRAALAPELSLIWSNQQLSRIIRGLFRYVREELITNGQFAEFVTLGKFVALHNRQGNCAADWFAGADIVLISTNNTTLDASDPLWFERPILDDSWELLKAAYGKPVQTLTVDLNQELAKLGYDLTDGNHTNSPKQAVIELAVFQVSAQENNSQNTLLFCTRNLMKSQHLETTPEIGTEFTWSVFQEESLANIEWDNLINVARRIFTLGWILLASAKHKQLPLGAGIASDLSDSLNTNSTGKVCSLHGLLTNTFKPFPNEALTEHGPFRYLNLLPITKSEYELAERMSARYLIELLELRGLGQTTKLYRKPINLTLVSTPLKPTANEC